MWEGALGRWGKIYNLDTPHLDVEVAMQKEEDEPYCEMVARRVAELMEKLEAEICEDKAVRKGDVREP